jgi:Ran GTPase-activating protein (RanGAP) involved in mRNA processing and transport
MPLPPVPKRRTDYSDIEPDDLLFALFHDQIADVVPPLQEFEREQETDEAKALHDLTDAIQALKEALTDEQEPVSQPDTEPDPDDTESQGGEGVQPEAQPEEPEVQPEIYP